MTHNRRSLAAIWPAFVLCAGLALVLLGAPARAAFPGANGQIVFDRNVGGNVDIYSMNGDGSGLSRLTTFAGLDTDPVVSPDGRRIAYASFHGTTNDIWIMDADGSGQQNLTNTSGLDEQSPAFSPDGSKIVFESNNDITADIHVMNADGSGRTTLASTDTDETQPQFSPDGSRIAYTRENDIWLMDANGSNQADLTNSPYDFESGPNWSPEGTKLVYGSRAFAGQSHLDVEGDVIVVALSNLQTTELTSNNGFLDDMPAFSPDGTRIAFRSDRGGNPDIWVMGAGGSGPVNVTNSPDPDQHPNWGVRAAASPGTTTPTTTTTTPSAPPAAEPDTAQGLTRRAPPPVVPPPVYAPPVTPGAVPPASAVTPPPAGSEPPPPSGAKGQAAPGSAPPSARLGPVAANVGATPPAIPAERSTFAAAVVRPDQVPLSATDVVRSLGLAFVLIALLGLPVELFNSTVKSNRESIAGLFAPVLGAFGWLARGPARALMGIALTSVVLATAVNSFLDPGFPVKESSAAFALGMLLGLAVIVANTSITWRLYMRRHFPGAAGGWAVYPGQIVLSGLCVLVSRMAHFVPGLMLGTSGDFEPDRPLSLEHEARRFLWMLLSLIAIVVVAWTALIPVGDAAAKPHAGFALWTLESALGVITIAGIETIVFACIPLEFLDGYNLRRWRPKLWLGIWSLGLLWFALVVLNPALNHSSQGVAAAPIFALFAAEAVFAIVMWRFFARRRTRSHAAAHSR